MSDRRRLESMVRVRVSREGLDELRTQAGAAGVTVAEYLRRRGFGRTVISKVDAQLIAELRRLGGLLRYLYGASEGANSKESAATLRAIRAAIRGLAGEAE